MSATPNKPAREAAPFCLVRWYRALRDHRKTHPGEINPYLVADLVAFLISSALAVAMIIVAARQGAAVAYWFLAGWFAYAGIVPRQRASSPTLEARNNTPHTD